MIPFEDTEHNREGERSIDRDLGWLLHQAHVYLFQGVQQQLDRTPMLADGLAFLGAVHLLGDNATLSEIARCMMRKPHSISGLTNRMAEKGFVEKKEVLGPNNRVYFKIVLTEEGKQFLSEGKWGADIFSAALSGLTLEEKQRLRRILFTIRESIAQKVKGYEKPPFPSPLTPTPYAKGQNEEQIG